MTTELSIPDSGDLKSFWSRPEGKTAILVYILIAGGVVWFWGTVVKFIVDMLDDTIHMAFLGGVLAAILYLIFGKRPQLMFRVLVRKLTSLFVAVYPIEIIEDKLLQMKKKRDKMNDQISMVRGSIEKLKRKISDNDADAQKRYGMASQAQKMASQTKDSEEQFRMQMAVKKQANAAARRQNANIGYAKLLERIQKVYKFLTHYATNVDYYIDDTQDEIEQKKVEYETTMAAAGAMKQAMAVIKGNATEEDIYGQAFDYIEQKVSSQLGLMDDLQRVSQNFMDGMDIENGAVDDAALQALNAFEQKALTAGSTEFQMVISDKTPATVPASAGTKWPVSANDYNDLLK